MRRAVSMSMDRELFAEVDTNADKLKKEGIVPDIYLNNNIAGGVRDFWLDPRGKDMQDAAQYFQYNVAEAKKLVAVSRFANGVDVRARFDGTTHITESNASILSQFLAASGIRLKLEKADYNTVFLPLILASKGNFDGYMSFSNGPMGFSPATFFARALSYNGGTTPLSVQGRRPEEDRRDDRASAEDGGYGEISCGHLRHSARDGTLPGCGGLRLQHRPVHPRMALGKELGRVETRAYRH